MIAPSPCCASGSGPALPFSAVADDLGFTRPGAPVLAALGAITLGYVVVTEAAKQAVRRSGMAARRIRGPSL
jgi:hypothetical protein